MIKIVFTIIFMLSFENSVLFSPIKVCFKKMHNLAGCKKELLSLKKRNRTDIIKGIKELVKDSDNVMKELGITLAVRLNLRALSVSEIESLLDTNNQAILIQTFTYLRKFKPDIHYNKVLDIVKKTNNKMLKIYGVKILALKKIKGVLPVVEKLINNSDPGIKAACVQAVGFLNYKKLLDRVIDIYLDPSSPIFLKIECLKTFGLFKDKSLASVALLQIGNPDISVKKFIIKTIANLGAKDYAMIIATLLDVPELRRDALIALSTLKSKEVTNILIDFMQRTNLDVSTLKLVFWALGQIKDERAVPALLNQLNSGNSIREQFAAEALGYIGSKKAIKPLIEKLDSPNENVADYAQWALVKITSKKFEKNKKLWNEWYQKYFFENNEK